MPAETAVILGGARTPGAPGTARRAPGILSASAGIKGERDPPDRKEDNACQHTQSTTPTSTRIPVSVGWTSAR